MVAYAAFWGYVFFGDLPGLRTVVGAAIILASGLLVMAIEIRRRVIAPRTA
jgi:drug/metabolite transporter (DMT)-like permease